MIKNVLIVRGVSSTDDLRGLGLPMAKQYDDADMVIAVSPEGKAHALKNRGEATKDLLQITFVDGDSQIVELGKILREIEEAYRSAHPEDAHLSQAFVGMFLFYWMGLADDRLILPIEMVERGDIERLRESATKFIESDFGNKTRTPDRVSSDESPDPAAA